MSLNRSQYFQKIKPFLTEFVSSLFIECFTIIVVLNYGFKIQWSGYTIFWLTCFLIFITYYIFTYQIFSFLAFVDYISLSQENISVIIDNVYPFRQGLSNDKNVFDKNGKIIVKEYLYYKVVSHSLDSKFDNIIFTSTEHLNLENNQKYVITCTKRSKIVLSIKKL